MKTGVNIYSRVVIALYSIYHRSNAIIEAMYFYPAVTS